MMEKEARTNKAGADLDKRNRNWQKIDTHLAESASKHITESGTNANGSYIKFDNGTMRCFGTKTISNVPMTTTWGGWFYGTPPEDIIYPHQFTTVQSANISVTSGNAIAEPTNITHAKTSIIAYRGTSATTAVGFSFCIIGRWKA